MKGFVYVWTNSSNGMKYIGSHKGDPDDGYIGSGVYFRNAFNKKPSDFKREIVYFGPNFREEEDRLLNEIGVKDNPLYYNLKNDAIGGWDHCNTEKAKKKRGRSISKSKKGKRLILSEESEKKRILNMTESKKGKAPQCSFRDKSGKNNPMYGRKHSESTKKKIAEKAIKRNKKYLKSEL